MDFRKINRVSLPRRAQQINGREGETATFLKIRSLNLKLCVAVSPHVISAVDCLSVSNVGVIKWTLII